MAPCSEQFTAAILPVSGMPLENEADPLVLFSDPGFPSSDQGFTNSGLKQWEKILEQQASRIMNRSYQFLSAWLAS